MAEAGQSWQEIAQSTKAVLDDPASTPEDALNAMTAWSEAYRALYDAQNNLPVPPSDIDRIQDKLVDKVAPWTNPAQMAIDALLKRYLSFLAAMLAVADTATCQFLWAILVPSPIASPLQEAQLENDQLGQQLAIKLAPLMQADWQSLYSADVKDSISDAGILTPVPSKP